MNLERFRICRPRVSKFWATGEALRQAKNQSAEKRKEEEKGLEHDQRQFGLCEFEQVSHQTHRAFLGH